MESTSRTQFLLAVGIHAWLSCALSGLNQGLADLRAPKVWQLAKLETLVGERALITLGALADSMELAQLGLGELAKSVVPLLCRDFRHRGC